MRRGLAFFLKTHKLGVVNRWGSLFKRQYGKLNSKLKSFPAPMTHRATSISVSIALGHASANAMKATAGLVHW